MRTRSSGLGSEREMGRLGRSEGSVTAERLGLKDVRALDQAMPMEGERGDRALKSGRV